MGNNCSVSLARPIDSVSAPCGLPSTCEPDECGCDCGDDVDTGAIHGTVHPLLDQPLDDSTPRTPRGPAPPWVASDIQKAAVDRTATGATPPRSPTAPRLTPPGLPDEELRQSIASVATLTATFDPSFMQELFSVTRAGNVMALNTLMSQVNSQALTLVCRDHGSASDSAMITDRCEQAADLVAAFLGKARDPVAPPPQETLVGTAASAGHAEAVRFLLSARADPLVADEQGCTALHKAAESGSLVTALLILDRVQVSLRCVSLSELTNKDGETPEMFAALAGASDICRAFEVFSDMQNDTEYRQLGSNLSAPDLAHGHRGVSTGDVLSLVDSAAEARTPPAIIASALLRRSTVGNSLVSNLFQRIPEDDLELRQFIEQACQGILAAEENLLNSTWNPSDPGLDPAVRGFVTTVDLRSAWQRTRMDAVKSESANLSSDVDEFWQTHLSAEAMVSTMRSAVGDTFQLLLTVLWLYTREAWLRHVLDSLAVALHAANASNTGSTGSVVEGATGATPLWRLDLPSALQPIAPLVDALAPCMQLVQSALGWFEEAGIRHSALTYRPLSLPMLGLQKLVDRYIAERRGNEAATEEDEAAQAAALGVGTWVALGGGTFFSSMSSRQDAIRKLSRTRSNVLLAIRPDDVGPCYPKHMSLRGSGVDDTLFPLDAIFRITRINRTVSSDLDPEVCARGANSRWPVMIIELSACSRHLEALELLEKRNDFGAGELEQQLEKWMSQAPRNEEHERLFASGELLARCLTAYNSGPSKSHAGGTKPLPGGRAETAAAYLGKYAQIAESLGDAEGAAHALLSRARCRGQAAPADAQKAVGLLADARGQTHPDTMAARTAWRELGALV